MRVLGTTRRGACRLPAAVVLLLACSPGKASDSGEVELTSVTLAPGAVSLQPGGMQQFSVTGHRSDGSSSTPTVTWSAETGSITAGGLYTAGATEGQFRVIARAAEGPADTSLVTIVQPSGTLTQVILTPPSVSLETGATQQFSVAGVWSDGSHTAPAVNYSETGGSISAGGLYTAGNSPGSYRVIATQLGGSLADTSTVTLTAPTITAITVSPPSTSLSSGGTQQFTAQATLSNGGTQNNPAVTWLATGGTITTGGLYTAGSTAGSFRVIGSSANGKADSSTVTITSGSGSTVLFQESFDNVNLSSRGWYDQAGTVKVSTAEHIPGSTASLEVNFNAGSIIPVNVGAGRHLFTASDAVYLSYWVKYSTTWVGSGVGFHPHEFHFLTNEDDQFVSPAYNHLTVYIEHNYQNGGYAVMATQDAANIDQAHSGEDLTNITENRAVSGCNGNPEGLEQSCFLDSDIHLFVNGRQWKSAQTVFKPNPGPGYKGDWHHVEVFVKLNTIQGGKGQQDGISQYWFDGTLVIDKHTLIYRTGVHTSMKFNQFLMAPYIGVGSPVAQTMWVDELEVRTAKP